ncbi:MAG: RidA family protein [Dehalococcoidia bacterium]|jgi:2-iminobutanoate/2-iminopropanoate deaminase
MEKNAMKFDFLSAAGPYSHVVEAGDFYFFSGMLPINLEKNIREMKDARKATEVCLSNIKAALEKLGGNMEKVVKVTVYLQDMNSFNDMNEVFKTYFPSNPPARACVAVKAIPGDFPVEIEVVALR